MRNPQENEKKLMEIFEYQLENALYSDKWNKLLYLKSLVLLANSRTEEAMDSFCSMQEESEDAMTFDVRYIFYKIYS